MKTASLAFSLAFAAAAAATAGPLPLKPGTYVLSGSPCVGHANAAEFSYNGQAFSYPHASLCLSQVRSKMGQTYRIATKCSAAGDGHPGPPLTITSTYDVASPTEVSVRQGGERASSTYRWCPAA